MFESFNTNKLIKVLNVSIFEIFDTPHTLFLKFIGICFIL